MVLVIVIEWVGLFYFVVFLLLFIEASGVK